MKRIIVGLGIGGLLALVVGLVLPHLPDSAFRNLPAIFGYKDAGNSYPSFQASAAHCPVHFDGVRATPSTIARYDSLLRSCATASDVMSLGAWLVVIGSLVLMAAVAVLILGRIRRRPALDTLVG